MFEKGIRQVDSKNEWLLLSASFTAKFELVFVWTLENVFLRGCTLKLTERRKFLLKNGNGDFQNSTLFEWSACFYVTVSRNFEHFQYFNFKTNFLKNDYLFLKTGALLLESTKIESA